MIINIISLFPEVFAALSAHGVSARSYDDGLYELIFFNPRDYTDDAHNSVDDRPYGGGPGMVMLYAPLRDAILDIKKRYETRVVYMSPQGYTLTHNKVIELSKYENLTILCGRYEGVDQRVIDNLVDEEISVGDYVLTGGEIPAMVMIDAMVRHIPGALGNEKSALEDSFANGIFDSPHYTRPEVIDGLEVPKVLLSGDHEKITNWRREMALARTKDKRPNLFEKYLQKFGEN